MHRKTTNRAFLAGAVSAAFLAGFLVCRLLRWEQPMRAVQEYRCAVLQEPAVLSSDSASFPHNYLLPPGVVFYAPTMDDMAVTDPGDIELHKLYVRIPTSMDSMLAFFPKAKDEPLHSVSEFYHILSLRPSVANE